MKPSSCLFLLLSFFFQFDLGAQTPLSVNLLPDTLLCNGLSNGSIEYSVFGGQPPYHYQWSQVNNGFVFAQGDIMNEGDNQLLGGNLPPNGYIIEITDTDGGLLKDTAFILTPNPIFITNMEVIEPICPNSCDGSIDITTFGGTGEIQVTWSDVDDITTTRDNLCQGSYLFFLEDENGCNQKGLVDLYAPAPILIEANVQEPSCAGFSNGELTIEPQGGTMPYSLQWENGSEENYLDDLPAGSYNLTITDALDCILDTTLMLSDGIELLPNVKVNYGCGDGSISIAAHPLNGESPYQSSWNTGYTGDILFGVAAGEFSLTITDANECEAIVPVSVDYVAPLEINENIVDVSCHGSQDGAINISLTGGLPPFEFSWNNNSENQNIESLDGGTYTLNVLADGCAMSRNFVVEEASPMEAEFIFTESPNSLLSATAFILGGEPPYNYTWSNGSNEMMAIDLMPNSIYSLSVTDQQNCMAEFEFEALLTNQFFIQDSDAVTVFPNPVNDWLTIKLIEQTEEPLFIQLFDIGGALINQNQWRKGDSMLLDMNQYPSGIYVVSLLYDGYVRVFKVRKD